MISRRSLIIGAPAIIIARPTLACGGPTLYTLWGTSTQITDGSNLPPGGTVPFPNLFSPGVAYSTAVNGTAGNSNYVVQPTWQVAGVHYGIGPRPGTTFTDVNTLTDIPGRWSINNSNPNSNILQIDGNNVTVDSIDFSIPDSIPGRHLSWQLAPGGSTGLRVTNCKFLNWNNNGSQSLPAGGAGIGILVNGNSINSYWGYNIFDGGCPFFPNPDLLNDACHIRTNGGGQLWEFNWFRMSTSQPISGCGAPIGTLRGNTFRYNVFDTSHAQPSGAHGDWYEDSEVDYRDWHVVFNLFIQQPIPSADGTQGFQIDQSSANQAWGEIGWNTMLSCGNNATTSPFNGNGMSTLTGLGSINCVSPGFSIHDNYLDPSNGGLAKNNWTVLCSRKGTGTRFFTNNIAMPDGSQWND